VYTRYLHGLLAERPGISPPRLKIMKKGAAGPGALEVYRDLAQLEISDGPHRGGPARRERSKTWPLRNRRPFCF